MAAGRWLSMFRSIARPSLILCLMFLLILAYGLGSASTWAQGDDAGTPASEISAEVMPSGRWTPSGRPYFFASSASARKAGFEIPLCTLMKSTPFILSVATAARASSGVSTVSRLATPGLLPSTNGPARTMSGPTRFPVRTAGGRVLGVSALGADVAAAVGEAYAAVERIRWPGAQYRRDIAHRALRASTRS